VCVCMCMCVYVCVYVCVCLCVCVCVWAGWWVGGECLIVRDLEALIMRWSRPVLGCSATEKERYIKEYGQNPSNSIGLPFLLAYLLYFSEST